jgi:polyphosphate kinase
MAGKAVKKALREKPPEALFFNRELSWLEFNRRVLDEALDETVPLLERLKFLAITGSNLDEFYMVRVGGLELLLAQNSGTRDPSGMTAVEQTAAVAARVSAMVSEQYRCYNEILEPALAREGIRRILPDMFDEAQEEYARRMFEQEIFPLLTPMAVRRDGDFPVLAGLGLNVVVLLAPDSPDGEHPMAVIPVPGNIERFVALPGSAGLSYVLIEDIIRAHAPMFFLGRRIEEVAAFRITRNAGLSVREAFSDDLLAEMEKVLDERKRSGCVRLEVDSGASDSAVDLLASGLDVPSRNVFRATGPVGVASLMRLATTEGFDSLKWKPWPPQPSPLIDVRKNIFDELSRGPVLLYHPYESFDPVVKLVETAAADPDVLSIKQILYRTSRDSPVIAALRRAAENGKAVTVLVELKARFDEARNIGWARDLERAGAQVIYGVRGLKTHAKACVVVRREAGGVTRYLHFGTGNYNERTAMLYGDISYFTRAEDLAADAASFFNAVCGYSEPRSCLKLAMAPFGLRDRLLGLVEAEAERARSGQTAKITAKMNSLVDPGLIKALYAASLAGVKIRLNVRGICCLRPGVRDLSENIHVVSVVDRFLEHARVFCFHHGGEDLTFISSADWMPRNLDRRVELLVPVEDEESRKALVEILEVHFSDNVKARRLLPDGRYERVVPGPEAAAVRSQEALFLRACEAARIARTRRPTTLEPYRPSIADT